MKPTITCEKESSLVDWSLHVPRRLVGRHRMSGNHMPARHATEGIWQEKGVVGEEGRAVGSWLEGCSNSVDCRQTPNAVCDCYPQSTALHRVCTPSDVCS